MIRPAILLILLLAACAPAPKSHPYGTLDANGTPATLEVRP